MLFKADDRFVLVLVRGDHEVNDVKVKNLLNAEVVELASHEEVAEKLGTEPGFAGPIGAAGDIEIYADQALNPFSETDRAFSVRGRIAFLNDSKIGIRFY